MFINDILICFKGGWSCGVGWEEDVSNLLWCEYCGIVLCFDCDIDLYNLKNLKYGYFWVLFFVLCIEMVWKCEYGVDGSSNVCFGLIIKFLFFFKNKRRVLKKERGFLGIFNFEFGCWLLFFFCNDFFDGGDGIVWKLEILDLLLFVILLYCEKVLLVCVIFFCFFFYRDVFMMNFC